MAYKQLRRQWAALTLAAEVLLAAYWHSGPALMWASLAAGR